MEEIVDRLSRESETYKLELINERHKNGKLLSEMKAVIEELDCIMKYEKDKTQKNSLENIREFLMKGYESYGD